jgi:hypothetical protein
MGLDMYAMATKAKPESQVDFVEREAIQLHYWREHPNLHGWMEQLYRWKGGAADQFNCTAVALDANDLDRLEADLKARQLPETSGFFFGVTDGIELEDVLAFVAKAWQHLADGLTVFYTCWW